MKEAPSKLPKNKWLRLVLLVFLALLWVLVVTIAVEFVIGYLLYFILGRETFNTVVWSAIYSALSYGLALLIIVLVPRKLFPKWKVNRESLGLKDLPTWTDIGLAPVGYILALILAGAATWLFTNFSWFNAEEVQDVGFGLLLNGVDRVIAFITLVVVAPIAEEIIFRGWLYGRLREDTASVMNNVWSIILSSLLVSALFGLVHLQWNVAVDVFCLSVVLCALREVTGTIYAGILTHILKNGIAFYLLYVVGMV
ncbi:CPBP family intramembrane metalloprotease [Candidatus Saccharibacteria bacterium]|nr:CPBP family intramembrane metalloprotease [Candidatus Saccharibacteria bacterium]